MKKVDIKDVDINSIDENIYVLVYNERDWESVRLSEMSLKTKSEFYAVASQLSDILFEAFDFYHEENIYIGPFLEMSNYCKWKDINSFNLVQELKSQLKPKKYYLANVKKDKALIEKLIEENMRYLTQSYFYLQSKQILIQVGHNAAFLAFSKDLDVLNNEFASIIKNHLGWHCELTSFYKT